MTRPESRLVRWLEVVSDLVAVPRDVVPTAIIGPELQASFEAPTVSWNVRDSAGRSGLDYWSERSERAPDHAEARRWVDHVPRPACLGAVVHAHRRCGAADVPAGAELVANPRDRAFIKDLIGPYELQRSCPCR